LFTIYVIVVSMDPATPSNTINIPAGSQPVRK